ncbi:MAG: hypothetical protein Q9218_000397 [Villophora microphyllina]
MNHRDFWPKDAVPPNGGRRPPNKKKGLYFDGKNLGHRGNPRLLVEISQYEVEPNWGTRYPCKVEDLESYRNRPPRTRKVPISGEYATRMLVDWLGNSIVTGSKEHKAVHNLANGMQLEEWGPDLVIKAFDDLDILFFRGILATRTQLGWADPNYILASGQDPEGIFGLTECLWYGRCHISLNAIGIFLHTRNPYTHMWATLLHEMVHAYFFVLCEHDRPTRRDYYMGEDWVEGGHGEHFRRVLTAVDKRFRKYFNMGAIARWEADLKLKNGRCGVAG